MLPDGWRRANLDTICDLKSGKFVPAAKIHDEYSEGLYPCYGGNGLRGYVANFSHNGIFPLIGRQGALCGNVKKASGEFYATEHAVVATPAKNVHSDWLYYQLISLDLNQYATGQAQPGLSVKNLAEISTYVPPYEEQKNIASTIHLWDDAISQTSSLIESKQKQKKALMQRLLTGKNRFPEFEDDVPTEPLGKAISEVTERNNGQKIQRVLSVTNHSGFVLPEEYFSRRVASEDLSNYKIIRKGQYAYNPSRINVGSLARLDQYDEGVLSPMYVIFECDSSKLDQDYLLHWLNSGEAQKRIAASTQGSVRDSVNFKTLASFKVKMPSLPEQQKIAAVLNAADKEIDFLIQKLRAYQEQKKGLMQQLLTGKKRVKIAQKEAA